MTLYYTEEETLQVVRRLNRPRLAQFVEADLVRPALSGSGPRFSKMDIARIELICELCDDFEMEDEVLDLVMSLIDQLHGVRAELRSLAEAVGREPEDVRARIAEAVAGNG